MFSESALLADTRETQSMADGATVPKNQAQWARSRLIAELFAKKALGSRRHRRGLFFGEDRALGASGFEGLGIFDALKDIVPRNK